MGSIRPPAAIALALAVLAGGCVPAGQTRPATTTYKVENTTYSSLADFLAAVRRQNDGLLAQVTPASQKLGGNAVLVLPSMANLRDTLRNASPLRGEALESMVGVNEIQATTDARAIEKGQVFDSVRVVRAEDPARLQAGDADYRIMLEGYGSTAAQWTLATRDGRSQAMTPPPSGAGRLDRLNGMNVAVLNAAADLGLPVARQPLPGAPGSASAAPSAAAGFFIDAAGHAITDAGVVQGCKSVQVTREGSDAATATVVASDRANGLALLAVAPAAPAYARLAASARQGDPIAVYAQARNALSAGTITGMVGLRDDSRQYRISAPLQAGDGGGPVFDRHGHVVGVVAGAADAPRVASAAGEVPLSVGFAIKASVVANFLEANGVKAEAGAPGKPVDTAAAAERAKAFTVRVTCVR